MPSPVDFRPPFPHDDVASASAAGAKLCFFAAFAIGCIVGATLMLLSMPGVGLL